MAIRYVDGATTDAGIGDYAGQPDAGTFAGELSKEEAASQPKASDDGDGSVSASAGDDAAPADGGKTAGNAPDRTLFGDAPKAAPAPKAPPAPKSPAPAADAADAEDPQIAKLESEIRALPKDKMPDAAKTAFEKLVKDNSFDNLGDDSKIAILSQVKLHPSALSVKWLTDLCHRDSFLRPRLGDQVLAPEKRLEYRQKLAQVVAYAGDYYKPGDNEECRLKLENTYNRLLERGGPEFKFDPSLPDDILGKHGKTADGGHLITLNPRTLPAGNGNLTSPAARHFAVGTITHEVSHYVNYPLGGYVGETRGAYVGFETEVKRKPTNKEMLAISENVVRYYPNIQSDIKTNDQKTDIDKKRAKYERQAYNAYIKLLSEGKPDDPAPPPVSVIPGDPQNLDNSAPKGSRP